MKGERKDARHLPMVWLTSQDEDISDPKIWKRVNPGVGYSLDIAELGEEYDRAKAASERSLQGFATMRLNRIPTTSLDLAWLSADAVARTRVPVEFDDFSQCLYTCAGLGFGRRMGFCDILYYRSDAGWQCDQPTAIVSLQYRVSTRSE